MYRSRRNRLIESGIKRSGSLEFLVKSNERSEPPITLHPALRAVGEGPNIAGKRRCEYIATVVGDFDVD